MKKLRDRTRLLIQLAFAALTNGYVSGFLGQKLYKGKLKQFCLPGLNCYSCPGALGSCPIGALQAVVSDRNHSFSFYVMGFLVMLGALVGRLVEYEYRPNWQRVIIQGYDGYMRAADLENIEAFSLMP